MDPAEMYERIDEAAREKNEAGLRVILCEMSPQDLIGYHCFRFEKSREQRREELERLVKDAKLPASFVVI